MAVTTGQLLFAVVIKMIFKEVIKETFEDSQSNKSYWDRPRTCVGVWIRAHAYKGYECVYPHKCVCIQLESMLAFSIHHKVNL